MARDAVAEVRERTDIVELVGGYVQLNRAGRSYKGLCPFHQEKTPSFIVFPDSQNFHCFGCGKGGDAFTFYMGVEHTEFRDALQELARRAGVELASAPTVAPEVDAHRRRLIELNELAATFFANVLHNSQAGAPGRETIERRGLSPEVVERFRLGFAPDSWDGLLRFLGSRGHDAALAAEAGLLSARDAGGHYDRFRGRLMFPIRTRDGEVVGFGGRIVGEGQPKYLNSPQSAIFDKSSLVYGLDVAREEVRRRDQVVIVEGYMDALAAHQFGHANVVAAMGTALTEKQVGQIKRLSKHIVLALDADAAGQMATVRGLETMRDALDHDDVAVPDARGIIHFERKLKAEIAIVSLPEGKDPDELIRRSPESWPEVVASARPFLEFLVDAVAGGVNPDDARAKAEAVARLAPVLRQVGDRVVMAHHVSRLAAKLQLDERLVLSEVRRGELKAAAPVTRGGRPAVARRASPEDHLLAVLLRHRDSCGDVLERVPEEDVLDGRNRELLRVLRDPALAPLDADGIVAGLSEEIADHAERLLASLDGKPEQFLGQVRREAEQALDALGKERFLTLMRGLQADIREAQRTGDAATLAELSTRLYDLSDRHRRFYPPPSPYFRDSRDTKAPA
ncbi:MAG: DNA primase [uncultured Thermomicrobiales bacterium]|uniref:DNA primase n=1 Tax=uncultured Thermomicrobiales bacterium TaxID=1645740 RepID=A0A6J4VFN4_9BACT|nr:MAG: DNA primase [uncultured Thermomicrobiales bacterium]